MADLSHLGGWIDDGGHEVFAQDLPTFAADAAPLMLFSEPAQPILLYKAWKVLGGVYPPYPAQQIGDCVSFGHAHANDLRECVEVVMGEKSVPCETMTEWIYGASRAIAGMLGPFDGSYGAAAVKAMIQWGIVSRAMMAPSGAYSGPRAKRWGTVGPPADVKAKAADFKLGNAARIKTREEAISALWNGMPITICSSQGFTMERDAHGFCSPRGRWGHCMFVAGWRPTPEGFLVCQSWGADTPSGPLDLDQPSFSFWCNPDTMVNRIFAAGDSWALYGAPDFQKQPLPKEFYIA